MIYLVYSNRKNLVVRFACTEQLFRSILERNDK